MSIMASDGGERMQWEGRVSSWIIELEGPRDFQERGFHPRSQSRGERDFWNYQQVDGRGNSRRREKSEEGNSGSGPGAKASVRRQLAVAWRPPSDSFSVE